MGRENVIAEDGFNLFGELAKPRVGGLGARGVGAEVDFNRA